MLESNEMLKADESYRQLEVSAGIRSANSSLSPIVDVMTRLPTILTKEKRLREIRSVDEILDHSQCLEKGLNIEVRHVLSVEGMNQKQRAGRPVINEPHTR